MPIKERFDNYPRKTSKAKRTNLMPCYSKQDIYKFFRENNDCSKYSIYNINKIKFSEILDLYNISLKEIYKSGSILVLPNKLGALQLLKKKITAIPKRPKPFKLKDTLDEMIWIPIFSWLKYNEHHKASARHIALYSFKPTRQVRDELNKAFDRGEIINKIFTAR